jgi:hypothetical protein
MNNKRKMKKKKKNSLLPNDVTKVEPQELIYTAGGV